MDSDEFKEAGPKTRRRSARQASKTVLYSEDLKPRRSLKRTKEMRAENEASRNVNGSNESKSPQDEDEEDGETPLKQQKLEEPEMTRDVNACGDGFHLLDKTDVEMREDGDQDQDMNSDEETEQNLDDAPSIKRPSVQSGTVDKPPYIRNENVESDSILSRRRPIHSKPQITHLKIQTEKCRPSTRSGDLSSLGTVQHVNQQDALRMRCRNSLTYQKPKLGNQKTYASLEPHMIKYQTIKHPMTNQTAHLKNTEFERKVTSVSRPASTSKGWVRNICRVLLCSSILIGLVLFVILNWKVLSGKFSHVPHPDVSHPVPLEKFDLKVADLQALFPTQRSVFWKRSRIHLKRHLEMVEPTEPVSVILAAGLRADRTMGCLAQSLAVAYSALRNASVLEINGTTKRAQDSDRVKLDIDESLKEAFAGDKSAAVVHHFEDLPPASTLIFYRYCDHENAAYKKVFLVFTVMLSVDDIEPLASLSGVEDMVHDHIKKKFITSDVSTKFNQMDLDKLSGLWSRISHLILPVAEEPNIEQQGCGD